MGFYIYTTDNRSNNGQGRFANGLKTEGAYKHTSGGKKIFLVDDDADDRGMFKKALEEINTGLLWAEASNGEEALNRLQQEKANLPDLIFLDINMPVMTGWQLLTKIKAMPELKDIPVVIFSSSSNVRDVNVAFLLEACCYWTKPLDFTLFKEVLRIFATMDIQEVKSVIGDRPNRKGVYFSKVN